MIEYLSKLLDKLILYLLAYDKIKQDVIDKEIRKEDEKIENTEHSSDDVYAYWLRDNK